MVIYDHFVIYNPLIGFQHGTQGMGKQYACSEWDFPVDRFADAFLFYVDFWTCLIWYAIGDRIVFLIPSIEM